MAAPAREALPISPFAGVVFLSVADESMVLLRDGRV